MQHADATIQVWAMVESQHALENLQSIVSVPGLDGVYVGPNDLALSLGATPGTASPAREVQDALSHVLAVAHHVGVAVGAYCADADTAASLAQLGYDLVTPGNDVVLIREGASRRIAITRGIHFNETVRAGY